MGTKDVYPPDRASNLAVSGSFYKARAFQFHPLLTDQIIYYEYLHTLK